MEIGLGLPQLGRFANPDAVRHAATAAERAGYASLWAVDRLLGHRPPATRPRARPEPCTALDPFVALAAAAAVTESIRIGTSGLVAPLHPAVLLARSAASLDRLSDGRFTLGLGLGWSREEYDAVGAPIADRAERLVEQLGVMARIWADEVVEIETTCERIAPTAFGLHPVHGERVPLLLSESTPEGIERIARWADGWHPAGVPLADLRRRWARVRAGAERAGRDPADLRLVVRADVTLTTALGRHRPAFVGSLTEVRDDVRRTAAAGAHELVLDLQGTVGSVAEMLDVTSELLGGRTSVDA